MNSYLKALLEEAYDVAVDCEKYEVAQKIVELFHEHKEVTPKVVATRSKTL